MNELLALIGKESALPKVAGVLRRTVERDRPAVVGSLHATCS